MIITKHGKKRIKERIGLPKRAHIRHIHSVLEKGGIVTKMTIYGFKMIYNGSLYIFANSQNNEPILVTTYEEPRSCIKVAGFRR